MKNKILKLALALLIFTAIPLNAYAKGIAEIRIHKNELTGEIYSNENRPIKVIIEKQGKPLKIGIEIPNVNDPEKYTPERGGLYKKDTKTCTYEWYEGDKKRKEIIKLDRYEQAPAGEFFAPPERISQDRLIFFEDNILNCGGGKVNYLQMQEWLSTRPLNPFKNYSEKLNIEADEGQYQINIARDEDRIKTTGNLKLSGYFCEKDNKKGLCSEHFSIKDQEKTQIDLIIIADGEERQIPSTEDLISGINAEYSSAVTFVGSFSSRASSLLDWTLSIEETGLRNPKIEQIFNKFLNIANGLFILVLLGIAFLWNFSIFLPKNSLHKMLAFFAIAML
ncbi:MAG: hypothetical protein N4A36_03555, partial [Candidatus Gracilibacteria bacterium]|nr:hypothetical protein [Candidatus Gracilibacteria bacterium]